MIVYLRSVMNLTTQTYHSKVARHVWLGPLASASSDSAALGEADSMGSLPEDSDSDSERESGEYEWQGPPGNPMFPDPSLLSGRYPEGRWVRTQKGLERAAKKAEQQAVLPSASHLGRPLLDNEQARAAGGESDEAESEGSSVLFTVPPGPYVPEWLRAEERTEGADDDQDHGLGPAPTSRLDCGDVEKVAYHDVGQYFLAQKEDAAADFQLQAQVRFMPRVSCPAFDAPRFMPRV